MANSGSTSVAVTSYDTLKFSWEEASQDITNNKTKINWKLQLIATSYGRISSTASKSWSVTVNGTTYSGTNQIGIGNNETKTLASGSTTIAHNSDGTKTFSYSFSQEIAITFSGSYVGTKSGSGTGTLDTIPRASSFGTITGDTIGGSVTVNITRNSSSFTHQLWYKVGNSSWYDLGKGIGTSKTFTIDMALCSQFPSATSGTMQLCVRTYNGSTQIGSDVYKNVTVYVPSSVVPSCTVEVTDATGYADEYDGFIKGVSKFKVVVTPTRAYDSDIASYSTKANGATYTSASFTTGVLSSSGALNVEATVKDNRGRTGSASVSKTVLDYSKPVITKLTVGRCDSDGKSNDKGAYAKVVFSCSVTSLNNKNTASYVLKYKKTSESTFPTDQVETLKDYANVYSVTDASYIFEADTGSSYDVHLEVSDNFDTTPRNTSVSTAFTLMHWMASGLAMALGKVAEITNFLDIGWDAIFRKNIYMGYYRDEEKNIFFKNNASNSGKTYANDGVYPHNCRIYSGSSASQIGIGMYDVDNDRRPFAYNDHENYVYSESVIRHQIAVGYPSQTLTLTSTEWTKIPLDTMNPTDLRGKYLEISDGGIKCNKNGFVKFSAQCYLTDLTAYDTIGVGIEKSSSSSMSSWFYRKQNHTTMYNAVTDYVADVKEGDIIYLMVRNSTAARGTVASGRSSTRMVVEYVG